MVDIFSQSFFGQLRNRPKSSHPKVTPTSRFQKTTIILSHSNLYLFIYIYIIYIYIYIIYSFIYLFIYLFINLFIFYLSIYLFIYSWWWWLLLLATLQIIAHTYPQILSPGDDFSALIIARELRDYRGLHLILREGIFGEVDSYTADAWHRRLDVSWCVREWGDSSSQRW